MPVDPIGIGALSAPPTPTANGALLTVPAGTAAVRLYLATGASITYTVAHDQPGAPPTALFTVAATSPVTFDEPLAGGQQVYVTAVTGSVLLPRALMADLWHQFGSDLVIGATGDLAAAAATMEGQQRVLRRLLTNQGDYIWQPGYGAGLGQFVGSPASAAQIQAVVRSQIFKEAAVARTPEPVIDVTAADSGSVYVAIRYADATTGATQMLSFSVDNG